MITATCRQQALQRAQQQFQANSGLNRSSFLSIDELEAADMQRLLHEALAMKADPKAGRSALQGRRVALLFQKTSTRTRCSFEQAAADLGADTSYIDWRSSNFVLADLQDEVKVLSRYYDLIVARVMKHEALTVMRDHSEVPVVNGLCDRFHPCQALADYLTMVEYFGRDLTGLKISYLGDGNNVCRSLVQGAALMGAAVTLCGPPAFRLDAASLAAGSAVYIDDPVEAVRAADIIYTDTWVSMGDEGAMASRLASFAPYQVNEALLAEAPAHALVMHCLPAHPGQEITPGVLRSPRSVVFDQAENRTHAQKAVLRWLLAG